MKLSSTKLPLSCALLSCALVGQAFANSITGYSTEGETSIGRIGIAGVYRADNIGDKSAQSFGGQVSGGGGAMYKRWQVSAYARFSFTGGSYDDRKSMAMDLEMIPRFGFNVLTSSFPLYVNFILYGNMQRFASHNLNFGWSVFGIGGELEGKIPLGSSAALEYSAGYVYDPNTSFTFNPASNLALSTRTNAANQTILASIGMSFDLTPRLHSYVKLYARYQSFPASPTISYETTQYMVSARNSFNAALEVGLGF